MMFLISLPSPMLPPPTHTHTQHTQYFIYTSDHGYNLGQFRDDSHKTQVYDHNLRVPAIIQGPKVSPGSLFTPVTSMVDLGPTILELAAGGNDAGAVPAIAPPPGADLDYSMSGADFPAIQKGFAVGQDVEAKFGGEAKWFVGAISSGFRTQKF